MTSFHRFFLLLLSLFLLATSAMADPCQNLLLGARELSLHSGALSRFKRVNFHSGLSIAVEYISEKAFNAAIKDAGTTPLERRLLVIDGEKYRIGHAVGGASPEVTQNAILAIQNVRTGGFDQLAYNGWANLNPRAWVFVNGRTLFVETRYRFPHDVSLETVTHSRIDLRSAVPIPNRAIERQENRIFATTGMTSEALENLTRATKLEAQRLVDMAVWGIMLMPSTKSGEPTSVFGAPETMRQVDPTTLGHLRIYVENAEQLDEILRTSTIRSANNLLQHKWDGPEAAWAYQELRGIVFTEVSASPESFRHLMPVTPFYVDFTLAADVGVIRLRRREYFIPGTSILVPINILKR